MVFLVTEVTETKYFHHIIRILKIQIGVKKYAHCGSARGGERRELMRGKLGSDSSGAARHENNGWTHRLLQCVLDPCELSHQFPSSLRSSCCPQAFAQSRKMIAKLTFRRSRHVMSSVSVSFFTILSTKVETNYFSTFNIIIVLKRRTQSAPARGTKRRKDEGSCG